MRAAAAARPRAKRQASPVPSATSSGKRRKMEVVIPVAANRGRGTERTEKLLEEMLELMRESARSMDRMEMWLEMIALATNAPKAEEEPRAESSAMAERRNRLAGDVIEVRDSEEEKEEEEEDGEETEDGKEDGEVSDGQKE
jgi:hypothetical protein